MMLASAALLLGFWLTGVAAAQPAPEPLELARRIQARFDTVRDFSAEFTHAYEGGVLRRRVTERGTVLMKKPGRMRWTYTSPERKLFVADGERLWAYVPEDRQVTVVPMSPGDDAGAAALLLAGSGSLLRDYTVSAADLPARPADTWAIKIVPRREQADYEWAILVVGRKDLGLRMVVTADSQGGQSTFSFTNVRENTGVPDRQFTFEVPRGVDVISSGRGQ